MSFCRDGDNAGPGHDEHRSPTPDGLLCTGEQWEEALQRKLSHVFTRAKCVTADY